MFEIEVFEIIGFDRKVTQKLLPLASVATLEKKMDNPVYPVICHVCGAQPEGVAGEDSIITCKRQSYIYLLKINICRVIGKSSVVGETG